VRGLDVCVLNEEFAQRSLMMILNMLFLNIIQRSAKISRQFSRQFGGGFCAGISTACGFLAYTHIQCGHDTSQNYICDIYVILDQ
jgi:hypothetical protein